ncbi:hypothetical protein ABEB36_004682 [Hypothenemus hampei]|uniref:Uncharacterized protein n=1 Tax=Hypothenemus hampei TaxID=57062 RepID=A0ABD1F6R7_HYPHA
MNSFMIFDHLNDLIFFKYNANFEEHLKKLAVNYGLLEQNVASQVDKNIVIQMFSPIVSSHRIMHFEFGNSYSSVDFSKELKMSFCEVMGYLFILISDGKNDHLLKVFITLAKYVCGPDFNQFNTCLAKSELYTKLIDEYLNLQSTNQAIKTESIEQLMVNVEITSTCLQILKESISKMSVHTECSKVHALLFVDTKLLTLYSSVNAKPLSSADILFFTVFIQCAENESFQLFLAGTEVEPSCFLHAVHVVRIFENMFVIYVVEDGNSPITAALYEVFYHLHRLRFIQVQREKESIQLGYENLELAVRKLRESLKKSKNRTLDTVYKVLMKKWDVIKAKYKEYLTTSADEHILRAEGLAINFMDVLKEISNYIVKNDSVLKCSGAHVSSATSLIIGKLGDFTEYFKTKGIKNFSLGSYPF